MSNSTATPAASPSPHLTADALQHSATSFVDAGQAWVVDNWLQILIAMGVAAAIVALLHMVRHWGMKLCQRSSHPFGWGAILGRAISLTGNWFMVLLAAELVSDYAGPPPVIANTVQFLFTIATVFQAAIWAREIILNIIERRTEADGYASESLGTAMGIIRLLVSVALFTLATVVVLDNLGVNVTGLVAGLGVGGIAIGLAAQGIFADLFAALSILFDKPFRKGDSISYDQTSGAIEEIGLKSTRIRSFTGEERIIANRNLLDKEITNNTQRIHRRQKWTIGVTYQTAPEVCTAIPAKLQEIVEAAGATFVRSGFVGFGASSLDFELEFDTDGADFAQFYDARSAIGIAILKRFNDEHIDIAYPTQTTFTAAPDGRMVLPYPSIQPVVGVDPSSMAQPAD